MILRLPLGRDRKDPLPLDIYQLASKGLTIKEMANLLGIGKSTLERKLAFHTSLKEAYKKGREEFNKQQKTDEPSHA